MMMMLGVVGEDGGLVASDDEVGRHVLGEQFEPGHVQRRRHRVLPRHRQRPAGTCSLHFLRNKFVFIYRKLGETPSTLRV